MKLKYGLINALLFVLVMWELIVNNDGSVNFNILLMNYGVLIIIINIIIVIFYFVFTKLGNKISAWVDKKKMEKYSLYEWTGDLIWLEFNDTLTSIKDFEPKDLYANYNKIKIEMERTFNNREKLIALKIYLEVKSESPRLNSFLSSNQAILVGLVTFFLVTLVDFPELTQLKGMFLFILFVIVWLILLMFIDFTSKQIDRNKVLLKLVNECLK